MVTFFLFYKTGTEMKNILEGLCSEGFADNSEKRGGQVPGPITITKFVAGSRVSKEKIDAHPVDLFYEVDLPAIYDDTEYGY